MRFVLLVLPPLVLSACAGLNNSNESATPTPVENVSPAGAYSDMMLSEGSDFDAARIDPGIVIRPDTSVDAKMQIIPPPENIDPAMIIPGFENDQADPFRKDTDGQ